MSTFLVVSIAALVILVAALFVVARLEDDSRRSGGSQFGGRDRAGGPDGSDSSDKKKHWLLGKSDSVHGKRYHIGKRTATVGRKPANFIQLSDEKVSRVHCRFHGSPGRCQIEDLDSSHGTYVNGDPLDPETPIPLRDGDSVRIGDTEFTYRGSASFESDDALTERKQVNERTSKRTASPGQIDVDKELLEAVKEADGDVEEVAERWGLEPEQLEEQLFGDIRDE